MGRFLLGPRSMDFWQPRGFGVARDGAADELCVFEFGEKGLRLAPGKGFELVGGFLDVLFGGAEAAAQIAGLLLEDPLQRRFEGGGKIDAYALAVVPQVHVNDRVGIVGVEVRDLVARRIAE